MTLSSNTFLASRSTVLGVPWLFSFLQLVGTANTLPGYISACGLLMVPRAGTAWGSISCLPVAPFGVRARASSQPGSQLGPGTGSGEKGEAAAQPFLSSMAGAATAEITEVSLLGLQVGRAMGPKACSHHCRQRRRADLPTGHDDGTYIPAATILCCIQPKSHTVAHCVSTVHTVLPIDVPTVLPHINYV